MAFGFWLLAFGFWLLAFGFWLLAFGFWLLAFGFWLLARPFHLQSKNAWRRDVALPRLCFWDCEHDWAGEKQFFFAP
ncbi:MAG TPA: hypothetical protein VFK06_10890 [Candidatus Angelobacter sp.]|nr:hypothetical protein [Candidatus Angelobacter sp.]